MQLTTFGYIDDEDYEVNVPGKYVICDTCDGHGKHSRAIDGNGITSDEWQEWDLEEREFYMSGGYDRCCEDCKGSGKLIDIDWDKLTLEEKQKVKKYQKEMAMLDALERAERRAGC